MTFVFSLIKAAFIVASIPLTACLQLDIKNVDSIRAASKDLSFGLMSYYHNNVTGVAATAVGVFPPPAYWWEAGAIWGAMIDNWAYTGDQSYVPTITQGLLAQIGPDNNFMPPAYYTSLGNDDQAFWALATLSAAEYGFPVPQGKPGTIWLDLSRAVFDSMVPRWDTATCNGGLRWQIFQSNAGYDYKNTISNAGLFQIAARLARYTGDATYIDWAEKTWDWMLDIGLISLPEYFVYDGTDPKINCTQIDHTGWSYNPAMLLYGTATLYNITNGAQIWADRTTGLLAYVEKYFFSPYDNATNIMIEYACEPNGNCNYDQLSFKAYLARWMAKSAILMPGISDTVNKLLSASAAAAAQSCSGGDNKKTCGQKWYVGGYDGYYGLGQQLSAMETVQSLLLLANPEAPLRQAQSSPAVTTASSKTTPVSTAPSSPPVPSSSSTLPVAIPVAPTSTATAMTTSTSASAPTPSYSPPTQQPSPTQPASASPNISRISQATALDRKIPITLAFLVLVTLAFA